MMLFLRVLAFLFLVPGFGVVFAARRIVEKYNLDKNVRSEYGDEMDEEELKQYKYNKAVVNLKMLGMLIALPGLILIMIAFR